MKFTSKDTSKLARALEEKIKTFTGLNHLELTIAVDKNRFDQDVVSIESNELVDYQYPKMFQSLTIVNFGGGWSKDDVGKSVYWLPVNYRYFHFQGGSNGSEVAVFYITPNFDIELCTNSVKPYRKEN